MLHQQADHVEQHVLEVDDAAITLDLVVGREQPGHHGRVEPGGRVAARLRGRGGVVVVVGHRDLDPLDLAREVAHRRPVGGQPQPPGRLGHQGRLVVDERRQLAADIARPEVAQLAQRGGVEGAGLDPDRAQVAQPAAHLTGRARGEGHGQHPLRDVDPAVHAVGDARGDRPGLAGAGTGEHTDRPVQRGGDLALLGVEALEERIGVDGRHRVHLRSPPGHPAPPPTPGQRWKRSAAKGVAQANTGQDSGGGRPSAVHEASRVRTRRVASHEARRHGGTRCPSAGRAQRTRA